MIYLWLNEFFILFTYMPVIVDHSLICCSLTVISLYEAGSYWSEIIYYNKFCDPPFEDFADEVNLKQGACCCS